MITKQALILALLLCSCSTSASSDTTSTVSLAEDQLTEQEDLSSKEAIIKELRNIKQAEIEAKVAQRRLEINNKYASKCQKEK